MKVSLSALVMICAMTVLPMTQRVVAGVAEKVCKAQEALKCNPSIKQQIKAIKVLGDANDCEMDCDGFKVMATRELARLASQDCGGQVSEMARKELCKDLKRKGTSSTKQRVQQALK